jgi:hypothetical protein
MDANAGLGRLGLASLKEDQLRRRKLKKPFALIAFTLFLIVKSAFAANAPYIVIEGTVIGFNQKVVTVSTRGLVQRIPRELIPDKTDLTPGIYLHIEVPISPS